MNRLWGHFKTITKHKIYVTVGCFRIGLYKQGLLHDLSKYSPIEFWSGVRYYQGYRSPINQEKEEKGYSLGWLHHKGRNRHHFEYWIDQSPHPEEGLIGVKMPRRYLAEMFIDRICASKIYKGDAFRPEDPLLYFLGGKKHCLMNERTAQVLEELLTMYRDKGEQHTFQYMKKEFLKDKNADY